MNIEQQHQYQDPPNQSEQKIIDALRECQGILEALPFAILITDQSRKIFYVNTAGLNILERPKELVLLCSLSDFFQESDVEAFKEIIPRGIPGRTVSLLKTPSGKEIPMLHTMSACNIGGMSLMLGTFLDLSDRRNRMNEWSEARRQYSSLLENLPGMVYRCRNDHNWTMEFMSSVCAEITGYQPEEVIGNRVVAYNDLIMPEDQERIWNEVQEKLAHKAPYVIEYRIRTKDGKTKWVWEKANGVFDAEGNLLQIEGFIADVSDTRHAEILQEVVFDISTAAYTASTLDELFRTVHSNLGKIMDVENFYIAMYDREHDTISLPYQVDSKDKFVSFPAGKTLTGYVIRREKPLLVTKQEIMELAKEGHINIVGALAEVWLGVPLIVNSQVTGVLAVQSYKDQKQYNQRELELLMFVADQVAALVARRSAEDSFRNEKAFLDQLFESSPEAIIQIDLSGKIVRVNSEFLSLFGYSLEEILYRNVDEVIANPANEEESRRITAEISAGKGTELETLRRHKNGNLIDVSLLVTPVMFQDKIVGAYGIYRDISFRKQAEKALIEAKERAEGADRLKSAFLSNMSHEIRTPMNAILGFSTLLTDPGLTSEDREEFLQIIKDRGNDLMRIIDDIIDISKIESGQINIDIKQIPVNILLSNLLVTLKAVKTKTSKDHITLNYFPARLDPEFRITTDGNRLRQIMTNLVENALKFTDSGHVDFGYTLQEDGPEPYIEFFVRDTGIGISKEMQSIIFERFRQADDTATRKYGGTGLGLTISRNLARLLGGDILVESEKGKGATFLVRLPIPAQQARQEIRPEAKSISVKPPLWSGKNALIVEDEETNYLLLNRMLKNTGLNITWAKNGIEAIDLCSKSRFDIVLMDIRMPIMDGYETTIALKKKHKDLVVIAQTAYALKGEKEKSIAAGCDNYIAKPIDVSELLTILSKYLNN